MSRVAVIGAGMAGVTAARNLLDTTTDAAADTINVTVYEKSRGMAGRMSTRRTDHFEFDHGAQYFTARDPRFKTAVTHALNAGHIAEWTAKGAYLKDGVLEPDTGGNRYVSTPRMNTWVKALGDGLDVRLTTRVASLRKDGGLWTLIFEDGSETSGFDWVIMAAPAPQVRDVLPNDVAFGDTLDAVKMDACFALMLGFPEALDLSWDSLRAADGLASWLAINSAKPGRPNGATLMVHSGPEWSNTHIDDPRDWIQAQMENATAQITGLDIGAATYTTLHFWRFAAVSQGADAPCLVDAEQQLIAAGDWCLGGRVEGAYLSGLATAEAVRSKISV